MGEATSSNDEQSSLAAAARWLIILAVSWFLLRELGIIIKPLLLAVLVGYVIIPIHAQVKKRVPGRLSIATMALLSILAIFLLAWLIQSSVRTLSNELPVFMSSSSAQFEQMRSKYAERYPWLAQSISEIAHAEQESAGHLKDLTSTLVSAAANTLSTAIVVGLYLMFLLVEAGRFPDRVRNAFSPGQADGIMHTITNINRGITDYLTAKVKASLILAVPIFIVLFVFDVRLALVWGLLAFFCNFIPYIGSVVAFVLPAAFALVQFGPGWEAITVAALMLLVHLVTSSVIEPAVIGKAVGVSPVVILFALAFWGYCWGLTGMFLAVPLTVMIKIICEHIEATKPIAKLVSDQ